MKSNRRRGAVKVMIVVLEIITLAAFVLVPKAVAQGYFDLVLYYRVRFEVLGQSPQGQHYIDLFDTHARDITKAIMSDRSLTWESINMLTRWQSNLEALVNGHGDEVVLSEEDVASVKNYLQLLAEHANPELQLALKQELSAMPMDDLAGMTMKQAWAYLNEDPRFQDQDMGSEEFPTLKPGSNSALSGSFSGNAYEVDFDEGTWALSSWNNGVAEAWMAENRDLSNCTITTPRTVSNPYATLDISYKTLGNVNYKVETHIIPLKDKVMVLYILYQPIEIAGLPLEANHPFILYPGDSDTSQCIEQSEAALASLHFVSDIISQSIQ